MSKPKRPSPLAVPVPPWGLAVTAILSVQLGSALSVGLIEDVGPAGTAWLRLSMGALILLAIARPPLRSIRRPDVLPLLGLGITTGVMTVGFLAAVE
ncbi:MAG: EamA family transporter, partial [Actinomycetes bacterium]